MLRPSTNVTGASGICSSHAFAMLWSKKNRICQGLIRYVVLNPVRAGMVDTAGAWAWSSYRATAGLVTPPNWLDVHWTLAQFDPWDQVEGHRLYREFVAAEAGLTRSPWEDLRRGLYLGSLEFGEKLRALVGTRELSARISARPPAA